MNPTKLLERCIYPGWETTVEKGMIPAKQSEIEQLLRSETKVAREIYGKRPGPGLYDKVVQLIATPVLMAQLLNKNHNVRQDRRYLFQMPPEEQAAALTHCGIRPGGCSTSMLILTPDQTQVPRLTAHIAATYLKSTWLVPRVVQFHDLVQAAYRSTFDDEDGLDRHMERALLIVQYPLAAYPGVEKAAGAIFSHFAKRSDTGAQTVLIDTVSGALGRSMSKGLEPRKGDIDDYIYETTTGKTRLDVFLTGAQVVQQTFLPSRQEAPVSG